MFGPFFSPTAPMTTPIDTEALVIGAGPVGLFQVFQLGLQGIACQHGCGFVELHVNSRPPAPQHVVVRRGDVQHPEDALGRAAVELVGRLHDAAVLLAARGLADDAVVPGQLVTARVERLDLAARLEDHAHDDHAETASRRRARPTRA